MLERYLEALSCKLGTKKASSTNKIKLFFVQKGYKTGKEARDNRQ